MVCHASEGCKRPPAPQCLNEHHQDAQKPKKSKFKLNSKGSLKQMDDIFWAILIIFIGQC